MEGGRVHDGYCGLFAVLDQIRSLDGRVTASVRSPCGFGVVSLDDIVNLLRMDLQPPC